MIMGEIVFGIVIGIAIAICVEVIRNVVTRCSIEKVRKPKEMVECYNATVLIDDRGQLAWVDNDRVVQKIRRKHD